MKIIFILIWFACLICALNGLSNYLYEKPDINWQLLLFSIIMAVTPPVYYLFNYFINDSFENDTNNYEDTANIESDIDIDI